MSVSAQDAPQSRVEVFELPVLNRVWTDLDSGLAPVRQGGLTIQVRSPRHALTVHGHKLTVRYDPAAVASGDLTFDVWLDVDLEGEGDLVATILETGAVLQDRVRAPRQTVRAAARVRLLRADGGGVEAYRMQVVEPFHKAISFQVESGLARQLVDTCGALRLLLGGLDCGALQRQLAVMRVDMPATGDVFALDAEALGEGDLQVFRYLEGLAHERLGTPPQTP